MKTTVFDSMDILNKEFENSCIMINRTQTMKVREILGMIWEVLNYEIEIESRPKD